MVPTHGIAKVFLSVCLSVCLSVRQTHACDKTKETCAHILILHNFLTKRMVRKGRPLLAEILDQTDPLGAN